MTEELLDASMSCPHQAAMIAAGWARRQVDIGKLTRRHLDHNANLILSGTQPFEDILRSAGENFDAEATRRPYLGLPADADPFQVYTGQLALLQAGLYAVKTFLGYIPPSDAIAVIRPHGTWTQQREQDLRFNLHLQGLMVQAGKSRLLYQPLVIGSRGPDGQDSPLTRFWHNNLTGPAWAHDWTDAAGPHRLGKEWRKRYALPAHVGAWVTEKLRTCQPQAGDPYNVIFPPAVEVLFEPWLAAEWKEAVDRLESFQDSPERVRAPRHWNQCVTPTHRFDRCPFIEHCWDGDDHHLVRLVDLLGSAKTLPGSSADMEE